MVPFGFKHSEDTRKKMSLSAKGRVVWSKGKKFSVQHRRNLSIAHTGYRQSFEERLKHSLAQKGEKGSNWRGGVWSKHKLQRNSLEMKEWKRKVFERDDYTCQLCGVRGGELRADHVMPFAFYPDLRFEVLNGQTLCVPCHAETPTFSNRVNIFA